MWWNGRFTSWMCSRQICSNCVMLSCQYGPKSLRNVSNTLLNLSHKELRQFWRQKGVQPVLARQRFSIPVLATPPPPPAYLACLALFITPDSDNLLIRSSVHLPCSDWHCPNTASIAPYSLIRGNPLKFSSLQNIHSWNCAVQCLHTRTSVTSYTSVNIYNLNSRLAHFNALCMEHIHSLQTGIMAEYPVMQIKWPVSVYMYIL